MISLETNNEPQDSLESKEQYAQGYKEERALFWSQIYLGLETGMKTYQICDLQPVLESPSQTL